MWEFVEELKNDERSWAKYIKKKKLLNTHIKQKCLLENMFVDVRSPKVDFLFGIY